jgi:hypothetical protein
MEVFWGALSSFDSALVSSLPHAEKGINENVRELCQEEK